MPTVSYPLETGGPARLRLAWRAGWKHLTLALDDRTVGAVSGPKELKEGRAFRLPDGSVLTLQLAPAFPGKELHVLRDGQPVPGSPSDPARCVRDAAAFLAFTGALALVLGAVAELFHVHGLLDRGVNVAVAVQGLVYLILAFFVARGFRIAGRIAVALVVLDCFFTLFLPLWDGTAPPVGQLFIRALLLACVLRGMGAMRMLRTAAA